MTPIPMIRRGRSALFEAAWPGGRALFTTRVGGCSAGKYAGLNIDPRGEDDPAAVAANHAILLEMAGAAGILFPRQVHGRDVVQSASVAGIVFGGEGDAVLLDGPGAAGVMTADCLGLVIRSPGRGAVVVHAGWRGIVAGIVGVAVERLGGVRGAMEAWLGPCIGPCCFEVGPDVANALASVVGPGVIAGGGGGFHADLARAAALQLVSTGISPGAINGVGLCTSCREDLFFSHRRDRGRTGRMASVVVLEEA